MHISLANNTHSAIVSIGNNVTAFIDGIPDECDHEWDGDAYHISASGKVIYWHTYRKWSSYVSAVRNQLIQEYHSEIGDPIVEGGVTCSKCKKLFQPQMF